MSLVKKIKKIYPSLTSEDFDVAEMLDKTQMGGLVETEAPQQAAAAEQPPAASNGSLHLQLLLLIRFFLQPPAPSQRLPRAHPRYLPFPSCSEQSGLRISCSSSGILGCDSGSGSGFTGLGRVLKRLAALLMPSARATCTASTAVASAFSAASRSSARKRPRT